ncbi:MAG: hypothetical protein RSB94_08040 [Erysipelotrichaceae bacterium]
MKVSCTFTLAELQRVTPSLRKEHFFSECPKVKEALHKLFWNLGCELPNKPDIVEGVVTLNKFNEKDNSIRINCVERVDSDWLKSKYASHQVKTLTDDVGMMRELDSISNARSYAVTTGVELV